jgi:hypothetical protein
MIAAGVNAKALSTYMGHANIAITYDRYGHLMPGNEAEAAALLDAYLVPIRGERSARRRPRNRDQAGNRSIEPNRRTEPRFGLSCVMRGRTEIRLAMHEPAPIGYACRAGTRRRQFAMFKKKKNGSGRADEQGQPKPASPQTTPIRPEDLRRDTYVPSQGAGATSAPRPVEFANRS